MKTNVFLVLSKYEMNYLELVFVLINYDITILSTLILKLFCYFPFNISPLMKIIFCSYCLAN